MRDLAIDRFRGALVMLMVVGDYIAGIQFVPSYLKHAPDIGFTIADTVAPAFVFIIGLNYGQSFARRFAQNHTGAYRDFALRYLSLIGIGAVISAGSTLVGQPSNWGVLQAIGVAGLLCLLAIRFSTWMRFTSGAILLISYQYFLDNSMLENLLGSSHGGFFGSLSWAALLMLSTAMADLWHISHVKFTVAVACVTLTAAASTWFVSVSKNRVSLSYILISLAISAVVFLLIKAFSKRWPRPAGFLAWWGENPLALYLLHLLVLGVFAIPKLPWWYQQAQWWLVALQVAVMLLFMTLVARALHRRATPTGSTIQRS